jgi:erythronate-4-phosphate dehydrogenase
MIKIVADADIPYLKGVLEPYAQVVYLPGFQIQKSDLAHADALLVRTRTHCNAELLEGTSVRFVGTATAGFDHIDTQFCEAHHIVWKSAPGCNADAVCEWTLAALEQLGTPLAGQTLAVVGVGQVGGRVANAAEKRGLTVLRHDPPLGLFADISKADIVSFHVPLSFEGEHRTFHLVDQSYIQNLKPGAWLINCSRGEVVETEALKRALVQGHLAGACLDVWEHEPAIDKELARMCRIATPHIAGYRQSAKKNATNMIVDEIKIFFEISKKIGRGESHSPSSTPPTPYDIALEARVFRDHGFEDFEELRKNAVRMRG